MPDGFTATASVATASPARYAKQLASHLGRRVGVVEEAGGTRLVLDAGSCLLRPGDGVLELHAEAPTEEGLDRVADVVGSHLLRFGQREGLAVDWQRGTRS